MKIAVSFRISTSDFQLEIMNRKEFFKTRGRLVMLGGITASAGYLVVNKKVSLNCDVSSTCKNCGIYSDCVNPDVKTEREQNHSEDV